MQILSLGTGRWVALSLAALALLSVAVAACGGDGADNLGIDQIARLIEHSRNTA